LEGGWGVGQTKEHDLQFEESFGGFEGCLPFVTFFDSDVVVFPSYVELSEEALPLQLF